MLTLQNFENVFRKPILTIWFFLIVSAVRPSTSENIANFLIRVRPDGSLGVKMEALAKSAPVPFLVLHSNAIVLSDLRNHCAKYEYQTLATVGPAWMVQHAIWKVYKSTRVLARADSEVSRILQFYLYIYSGCEINMAMVANTWVLFL